MSTIAEQTRLGDLNQELSALLQKPLNKAEMVAELGKLEAAYGADNVSWMLRVLGDDVTQS